MKNKEFLIINFITSVIAMGFQMSLNTALSFIFNNSVFIFSFFSGFYLFSMGLGVYITKFFNKSDNIQHIIFKNTLLMSSVMSYGILGVILLNEFHMYSYSIIGISIKHLSFIAGIILTSYLGISSGLELPTLSKEINIKHVLASDYLGNFFGILLFLYLFFIALGFINTVLILKCVGLFTLIIFHNFFNISKRLLSITIVLCLISILELFFKSYYISLFY